MKDNDYDIDTSELLSSLDKLKAKYSFNLDDDKETEPEKEPEKEAITEADEPVSIAIEPEVKADVEPQSETPWFIDSDDTNEETEDAPISVADAPEEPELEAEPTIEAEPSAVEEEENAWYLTTDPVDDDEDEPRQEQPVEFEDVLSFSQEQEDEEVFDETEDEAEAEDEIEDETDDEAEQEEESPTIGVLFENDDDDEFSDLDDDDELVVIGSNAVTKKEQPAEAEKEEIIEDKEPEIPQPETQAKQIDTESDFYKAFIDVDPAPAVNHQKPPAPVKSPKPAKPVKEPKEKKEKVKKPVDETKKPKKKLILNIVVAVALVVAMWASLFVTDILLVSNWSTPVFSVESEAYADGSKTYTGVFYQIQVSVDENGKIQRVILPWFAEGPNGDK